MIPAQLPDMEMSLPLADFPLADADKCVKCALCLYRSTAFVTLWSLGVGGTSSARKRSAAVAKVADKTSVSAINRARKDRGEEGSKRIIEHSLVR